MELRFHPNSTWKLALGALCLLVLVAKFLHFFQGRDPLDYTLEILITLLAGVLLGGCVLANRRAARIGAVLCIDELGVRAGRGYGARVFSWDEIRAFPRPGPGATLEAPEYLSIREALPQPSALLTFDQIEHFLELPFLLDFYARNPQLRSELARAPLRARRIERLRRRLELRRKAHARRVDGERDREDRIRAAQAAAPGHRAHFRSGEPPGADRAQGVRAALGWLGICGVLLVVAAVFLPGLAAHRTGAHYGYVDCRNTLKQMGIDFGAYRERFGTYPGFGEGADSWFAAIWTAGIRTDERAFFCHAAVPGDRPEAQYWCIVRGGSWRSRESDPAAPPFFFDSPDDLLRPDAPQDLPVACDPLHGPGMHANGSVNVLLLSGKVEIHWGDSAFLKDPPAFLGPPRWVP